jgi:hypothetical protein
MLRPAVLAAIALAAASPAEAQTGPPTQTPTWAGESAVIISNALAGGLTAGIRHALSGGSFGKGFLWGAAGGTVGYLGKRVASTRIDGAGFLGREIAAVGHSMVRNASEGRPAMSRLYLPLGPIPAWVTLTPTGGSALTLRIDPASLAQLISLSTDSRLRFDVGQTMSLGAPVFEAMRRGVVGLNSEPVLGIASFGTIVISDRRSFLQSGYDIRSIFVHETVHVIQGDFSLIAWSDPFNDALFNALGLGVVNRFVMFNEVRWAGIIISDWITDRRGLRAPFELEAEWLAR